MRGSVHVGTSSWADPGFVREGYPPDLPARDRLAWYAGHFGAVEVNSTFYAVPATATVERWAAVTPAGFSFDVKLHRLLSRHAAGLDSLPRPLRAGARTTSRGPAAADAGVGPRSSRLEALRPLLERLAPHPVAIELRHRGWAEPPRLEETLAFCEDAGAV